MSKLNYTGLIMTLGGLNACVNTARMGGLILITDFIF